MEKTSAAQWTALVFFTLLLAGDCQLQCRDENDNPVDWYVLYKLPRLKSSPNKLTNNGLAYAFITSDTVARGWTMSPLSIGDPKSYAGRTLQPLYSGTQRQDLLWALYNDQPPNSTANEELGHTKGVVMSLANGGFWLVHSVPHFPPLPASTGYSYPHTAQHYGQSFLCISLSAQHMDNVGVQLTYNSPEIYAAHAVADLERVLPNLCAAARNHRVDAAPWFRQTALTSRGSQAFLSFAKTAKFNKDLYADWVASVLQVDLLVESWLNGAGRLPSDCKHQFTVANVQTVSVNAARVNFTSSVDHSKWATAGNKATPWVCVGDINREAGQLVRGGGTVCVQHVQLWAAYRSAVTNVEPCPKKLSLASLNHRPIT